MKPFGSLNKPVTITISGMEGSGKAVLAAFIAKIIEEKGGVIDFDIHTSNDKMKTSKDSFWKDTKNFVNEHDITLTNKPIQLIIE